jgi:hypothetical protein
MKGHTMFKKMFICLALLLSQAFPFSYSSFPPITEKGALAVSPFLFADDKNHGAMEAFFFYGLTKNSDVAISMFNGYGTADFSFMPRYKMGNVITAIRMNEFWAEPQFTNYRENKHCYLQVTGASHITYDYPDKPGFYGIIAPGVFLPKGIDFCCDIIPGYYNQEGDCGGIRSKGFSLDIGPCIGFKIGEAFFVLSTPIYNVNKDAQFTVGLGFYYIVK